MLADIGRGRVEVGRGRKEFIQEDRGTLEVIKSSWRQVKVSKSR